jgi:hypothetical protein
MIPTIQSPVCHLFETLYPYKTRRIRNTTDSSGKAMTRSILIIPKEVKNGAEGSKKLAIGNPNKMAPAANNQKPVSPMISAIPIKVTNGRSTLSRPSTKMRNMSPRI